MHSPLPARPAAVILRARMRGFTLIELAISMLVITLLATVLLTPITTQVTQSRLSQAKADLDQINEALIGFALAQPKPYQIGRAHV